MSADTRTADLLAYSIALGDDALILGQRIAEWVSNAPSLEEELALANVALDHIGRARMFYGHAAAVAQDGRDEDDLAFLRDCREFTNLLINELPRGDFAFTMTRQFFVDAFNVQFLAALADAPEPGLAAIGAKARKESDYHLRRSRDWMLRLGDGTDESHGRAQRAVDALWGYTRELFEPAEGEARLADAGLVPDRTGLEGRWLDVVDQTLMEATLVRPEGTWSVRGGRCGIHTEHLGHLLAQMQFMQRAYPRQQW
jgi:ring-1,2-phenylacetyl-CoA epoxidase subunit PaaC